MSTGQISCRSRDHGHDCANATVTCPSPAAWVWAADGSQLPLLKRTALCLPQALPPAPLDGSHQPTNDRLTRGSKRLSPLPRARVTYWDNLCSRVTHASGHGLTCPNTPSFLIPFPLLLPSIVYGFCLKNALSRSHEAGIPASGSASKEPKPKPDWVAWGKSHNSLSLCALIQDMGVSACSWDC